MSRRREPRGIRTGHACLGCGSTDTFIVRRVVHCRACETAYYLPASEVRRHD